MVALDQNLLYIIIAVLVVIIILVAVFLRRRGSKGGPSNVNQYLDKEAELYKAQIVESKTGSKTKIPLYLRTCQDELDDFKKTTSELYHERAYDNSKIKAKLESLTSQKARSNLKKQLKDVRKKNLELNRIIEPEIDK